MKIKTETIDYGKYGVKILYIPKVLKGLTWMGLHKFDKGILPSKTAIRVHSTKDRAVKMLDKYAKQIERTPTLVIL